jgi:predicted ATPase with chaperone activity
MIATTSHDTSRYAAGPRPQIVPHPPAPITLEEAGLSLDLMIQLVLKMLHFAGDLTGIALAERLGLKFSVIEPAIALLKSNHHLEIAGGSIVGGASFRYRITDAGRTRARMLLDHSQYVGAAPVSLERYRDYMRAFAARAPHVATRDRVRQAFSHLVVNDQVVDQIGPAVNAGRSLFIYGPPGNGKTVMSQAIRSLLDGDIAVPHAIVVEGQIIRIYDPVHHDRIEDDAPGDALDTGTGLDRRWVVCRRPLVTVGGELTLDSMRLNVSSLGYYGAPIQLVANGGVLVVDDFGRQQVPPAVLLNRWIVPLESRIDYLTLDSGLVFDVPFAVFVVFATNLRPSELVDEAFLRRIHAKVFANSPTRDEFAQIFQGCCFERSIVYDPSLVDYLIEGYYRTREIPVRGCHPRDLIDHALSLAEYRGQPRRLTRELLDAACAVYFVDDRPVANAPM